MPCIPLQISKSSIIPLIENEVAVIDTDLGFALINTLSATEFDFQTIVSEDNVNTSMLTFWIPNDIKRNFPCSLSVKDKKGNTIDFTVEHCGNILPQTGAPGEPPRHETKGEHWRRIGEKCNPSFKNRLTVIAPVSTQNASQKRRFGLLKDSAVDVQNQQISYTYSEEMYPWILFLDFLPERDILNTYLTHFSQFESVNGDKGDYCKQSSLRFEYVSKFTRIMMFEVPSGKQCQINRIDGLEGSLYLTKVDALQIYPFKACYLVLLVPPFFDFRALLTADIKVEALAAWKFSIFGDSHTMGRATPASQVTSNHPQHRTKHQQSEHFSKSNRAPADIPGSNTPSEKLPAYAAVGTTPAPTPASQHVNPYQNSPALTDTVAEASLPDVAKGTADRICSNGECKAAERACKTPNRDSTHGNSRNDPPTVSPTIPWTHLPASQSSQCDEKPTTHMAIDQAQHSECAPEFGEGDQEMLPSQPVHLSTPLKKIINIEDEALSSQKTCLREQQAAGSEIKNSQGEVANLINKLSDPIITPSSPPDAFEPLPDSNDQHHNSDPIVSTPPSQHQALDTVPEHLPGNDQPSDMLPLSPDDSFVVEVTKDLQNSAPPPKNMSPHIPTVDKGATRSPIQDAFKRSSVLPANDKTRVCIDITGEDEDTRHTGSTQSSIERETQNQPLQLRFASLSPFTEVSRKWFHTFDANVIDALATKAQDIAINCGHLPSMNTALYLLSQGPWVPTHVSIHVRQAALAAVGVGWSWVNQVPTAFPFTCYEACLSLATLSAIPSNHVTPNEAIYEPYSTVCANLCQQTRNFLFSRFVLQCQACTKPSTVQIDTFMVTIKTDTRVEELCDLLVPTWNDDAVTECKVCSCLDVSKAQWKCSKLGPLIVIRIMTSQGASLPKLEEERLPLGHTFMFQGREYEIRCLITTTRVDIACQMIVLHTSQSGMISVYDHNNGIRVVERKHVSGKLLISGLVVLPVNSPKAILMTKQLAEAAGGGEVAQYKKKQIKVVKGFLKSPRKQKRTRPAKLSQPSSKNSSKAKSSQKKKRKAKHGPNKGEKIESTFREIDLEGLPRAAVHETLANVGVISMFDGVGSVYHIIKKN